MTPVDATDAVVSAAKAVTSQVMSVAVHDPVGNLAASTRVHQQAIVPAAVKQRNITVLLADSPNAPNGEPSWFINGAIPNDASQTVNWTTSSNPAGTELFAMSMMSYYFSLVPYSDYPTFKANSLQWPNASYNMNTVPASFWQDEAMSDGNNVVSRQSFVNFSGVPLYYMATIRLRILANTTNLGTN